MNTTALDRLLVKYLRLKYGKVCQLCNQEFPTIEHLMPIHILGKQAYPRLRYKTLNIVWGCDSCHREYEKRGVELLVDCSYADKTIKAFLIVLASSLPLLKHQDTKEKLNQLISEVKNGNSEY